MVNKEDMILQSFTDDPREFLADNLDLVERVLQWVKRRRCISHEDAEELRSIAFLKLIDNDYAVIRDFRGHSSVRTYLAKVVERLALDYRNRKWGKWRPSRSARRLGDVALQLDALISRDGRSTVEAVEMLHTIHQGTMTREHLEELADRLPARRLRRFESSDTLRYLAADERADDLMWQSERDRLTANASRELATLVGTLPSEERLILRLRFERGFKISRIATELGLEQKPLYRRVDRCLRKLRRGLEAQGICKESLR